MAKISRAILTVALSLLIVAISAAIYSNQTKSPQGGGAKTLSGPVTLTGWLKTQRFPMERFGPAPAVGDTRQYMDLDVLVMEHQEGNQTTPYYLRIGGRTEMIIARSGGNGVAGGLTFDEINDAYAKNLLVRVQGDACTMQREGKVYMVLDVHEIKILSNNAPLVIYLCANVTGEYIHEFQYSDRAQIPLTFNVGRTQMGVIWHDTGQIIQVLLNSGDAIGFELNSTTPINLMIITPTETNSSTLASGWGSEWFTQNNITSIRYGIVALRRGEYNFIVSADPPANANVIFNAWRLDFDPREVLFKEGFSSGVVALSTAFPGPPPGSFTIGRTGVGEAWTDQTWSFQTRLSGGSTIDFGFNATEPITLSLMNGSNVITEVSGKNSYRQTITVPSTGSYTFDFKVEPPKTSVVSFRCRLLGTEGSPYEGEPAGLIFRQEQLDKFVKHFTAP